ncbi:hypothetical protein NECAME_04882 [Necator americanus]|uniref:Uncharacterized protein n=1 Tax=Necator americanus TaxID=51031 RepID=W2SPH5_NECAM|nr:hypothetical protein NECAME_04882 [Necator americanus]ETN70602.1 hypothetical protein NECAME_04882 [Necator americanus]
MLAVALCAIVVGTAFAQFRGFQACDPLQYQRCQGVFNYELKIDPSLGIQTYQQLRAAIENKIGVDKAQGMADTCMAFKYYKTCYNSRADYANCANNPLGLLIDQNGTATGITEDQAFGYTKIFNQFDFSCGAGYAGDVFLTGINEMRTCDNNFAASVKADSNPMNTCAYVERAMDCYMTTFKKRCSQYPEVIWWGCNYERIGTQTNYPQCNQIFCTYNE